MVFANRVTSVPSGKRNPHIVRVILTLLGVLLYCISNAMRIPPPSVSSSLASANNDTVSATEHDKHDATDPVAAPTSSLRTAAVATTASANNDDTRQALHNNDAKGTTSEETVTASLQNPRLEPFEKNPERFNAAFDLILKQRKDAGQRATFIQIGANHGVMYDPLFKKMIRNQTEWIGLLVEPQTDLFQNLTLLHQNAKDWAFYNGAMADKSRCSVNGTIEFCETKTPGIGSWDTQGQLNTIDLRACKNNAKMHIKQHNCVSSMEQLVMEHASPEFKRRTTKCDHASDNTNCKMHVDLVQIDVEGKDFDVIKLIDFDKMIPQCIHFESFHLGAKQEQDAVDFLTRRGYTLRMHKQGEMDTLACQLANKV